MSVVLIILSLSAIITTYYKYKSAKTSPGKKAVIAGLVTEIIVFMISVGWASVGIPPWEWFGGSTTVASDEIVSVVTTTEDTQASDNTTDLSSSTDRATNTTVGTTPMTSDESDSGNTQIEEPEDRVEASLENGLLTQFHGELKTEAQEDFYTYTPPRSGTYRFEITGMYEERQVHICIYDSGGGMVQENNWIGNHDGITTQDLIPDNEYTIKIKQARNFSPYTLSVYAQAETIDVSNIKEINDEIIYIDQKNKYLFVPQLNGRYRFEIDQLYAEKKLSLYILDEGNGTVKSETWIGNGDGITIDSLQKNQKYTIVIKQEKGFSPYCLKIGYPSAPKMLEIGKTVENTMEFTDEIDVYTLIPPQNGTYSFMITGLQTDKRVSLYLTDEGGGTITKNTWIGNDQGIHTNQMQYGKTYYLKVEQSRGFSPYYLTANYSDSD